MPSAFRPLLRPARPADLSGFTIVELLVALVISGLLATVVFQSVLGQGRFAGLMSAREEVQQNARAALDLISSELRGVPEFSISGPLSSTTITIESPQHWGVVCLDTGTHLFGVFPLGSIPVLANGTAVEIGVRTPGGLTYTSATAQSANSSRLAECNATLDPDPLFIAEQVFRFSGGTVGANPADRFFVSETVTYAIGTASGVDGTWILRNGTPVAGPVQQDGLVFRYFDAEGNLTGNPNAVAMVEISVRTISRQRINGVPQDLRGSTVVYLRNRL
jgi:prepilin-type N-terminal cleavage/methylation domain-containing protein